MIVGGRHFRIKRGLAASGKRGFEEFVLLEMNEQAGGNARSGENEITAYPWAAHVRPYLDCKPRYVRELFADLGAAAEWTVGRAPVWSFAPQERLLLYGRWQDGIEPAVGLSQKDREQFQRLEESFTKYRTSGAFTVPLEVGYSNQFAALDQISVLLTGWTGNRLRFSTVELVHELRLPGRDYGALAAILPAWGRNSLFFVARGGRKRGRSPGQREMAGSRSGCLERVGNKVLQRARWFTGLCHRR